MSRSSRSKVWVLCLLGLVAALAIFFLFTVNRLPRTHLSTTLKFLEGYRPVRSVYRGQGYDTVSASGKRREVVALEEEFELPMSLDETHQRSRDELKPLSYVATYQRQAQPPKVIYGIVDKVTHDRVVVNMTPTSEGKTKVVFRQVTEPSWLDSFFAKVRNVFGGKGS